MKTRYRSITLNIPPDAFDHQMLETYDGRPEFELLTASQIMQLPPAEWLVDGLLSEDSLAAVVGQPGHLKSFLMLDLALAVAGGRDWHGRPVRQGPAIYVGAEGKSRLSERLLAWKRHHQSDIPENFRGLLSPVQLHTDESQRLSDLLERMEPLPVLIIFDTLAKCFVGGDENSAQDMGRLVAGMDRVRASTGATVIVVHHEGWDSNERKRRPRGSSALLGALDTLVMVKYDKAEGKLNVSCTKQKDAEEFDSFTLVPTVIDLGQGKSSVVLDSGEFALLPLDYVILSVLAKSPEGAGYKEVSATLLAGPGMTKSIGEKKLAERMSSLKERGLVSVTKEGRGSRYVFQLTEAGHQRL